jgi:hypothetical protein
MVLNWRSANESERSTQIIKTKMGSFKSGQADVENVSLLLLLVILSVTCCKKTLCFQGQIVLFICSLVVRHIYSKEVIIFTASFIRKCCLNHQNTLKGTEMAFGDVLYETLTRSSGLGEIIF